jgi:hypothetical protein
MIKKNHRNRRILKKFLKNKTCMAEFLDNTKQTKKTRRYYGRFFSFIRLKKLILNFEVN